MRRATKARVVYWTSMAISIVVPLITALCVFPFWKGESSGKQVTGMIFIVILICAVPLFKHIRIKLRSPSAFAMWAVIFGALAALNTVIDQLMDVALAGTISNAVGSVMFYIAKRLSVETMNEDRENNSNG